MPTVSEIPLLQSQPQTFTVTLGGKAFQFRMYWMGVSGGVFAATPGSWNLDISDSAGNLLVAGVPMLRGADIMGQYPEIGFPGQLWVTVDGLGTLGLGARNSPALDTAPGFDAFGGGGAHLYYVQP